jgi:multiple sugar transport system permease protein
MALSDRMALMFAGKIRQMGTPEELYRDPVDLDVARFLSQPYLNMLPAAVVASGSAVIAGEHLNLDDARQPNSIGVVGFPPKHCSLLKRKGPGTIAVNVERLEHAGAEAHVFVRLHGDGELCVVRISSNAMHEWKVGIQVWLSINPTEGGSFHAQLIDGMIWKIVNVQRPNVNLFLIKLASGADGIALQPSARITAQRTAGALLATPAAFLLILLVLLPSIVVLVLSLTDYQLGTAQSHFVGFDNYVATIADPMFRGSLRNTAIYVAVVAPASIGLGLIFALMIQSCTSFNAWYRTAFFLPVTATLVAMATAWEVLLHPTFGLFNTILAAFGGTKIRFLSDPDVALMAIAAIGIWKQIGFNLILFLAGLSTIPSELYESASLDGADRGWRRFFLISWPMLGPVTLFVVIVTLIRAFSDFEAIVVLTDGGPMRSTSVVLFQLYQEAFRYFKIGTGSALAVMFLLFIGLVSWVQMKIGDRRIHYV